MPGIGRALAIFVGNLLLRVVFALAIVGTAIGMTAAASDTVARCDAAAVSMPPSDGTTVCAQPGPGAAGGGVAAVAPDAAERSTARASAFAEEASGLVALATGAVLFSIFVILLAYRPRPGGVRVSHR